MVNRCSFWRGSGSLCYALALVVCSLRIALLLWAAVGLGTVAGEVGPGSSEALLSKRFEREIWPLLTRGEGRSCVSCHDAENRSPLHFFNEPHSDFRMLREEGYFSTTEPDALLGRVASTHPTKRM